VKKSLEKPRVNSTLFSSLTRVKDSDSKLDPRLWRIGSTAMLYGAALAWVAVFSRWVGGHESDIRLLAII
jgi:hypothetical protein